MNVSWISFCASLTILLAGIAGAETPHPLSSALANFDGEPWAVIHSHSAGYELRLLTEKEKSRAEGLVDQYRSARSSDVAKDIVNAYRSMPATVRAKRFWRIRRGQEGAVELTRDGLRAVLPMSSVVAILYGPTGQLAGTSPARGTGSAFSAIGSGGATAFGAMLGAPSGGRSSGRDTSAQQNSSSRNSSARRSSARGEGRSTSGRSTIARAITSGLLGGPSDSADTETEDEREADEPEAEEPKDLIAFYHLKHADAHEVAEVIADIFYEDELRLSLMKRTNTLVVRGLSGQVERIGKAVEQLDQPVRTKPETKSDEPMMLRTYPLDKVDAESAYLVLQTLLAGSPGVRLSVDIKSNRIIAYGTEANHETIAAAVKALQAD